MGIGKPFFKSMRVIWALLSHLKLTHITLINLKREDYVAYISLRSYYGPLLVFILAAAINKIIPVLIRPK